MNLLAFTAVIGHKNGRKMLFFLSTFEGRRIPEKRLAEYIGIEHAEVRSVLEEFAKMGYLRKREGRAAGFIATKKFKAGCHSELNRLIKGLTS